MSRILIAGLLLIATALPAAAQDSGGLGLSPEALAAGGPRGLARPLRFTFPSIGAADLQATPTPAERSQRHRELVARTRGDGGFLDGFALGQPRAASRQLPPPEPVLAPVFIDQRTRIVNRFEAPVAMTIGDNNVVQQQGGASGGGPTAQQQVANVGRRGGRGGGAPNLVAPGGNIVQAVPATTPRRDGG